jgi:hypothetical protein
VAACEDSYSVVQSELSRPHTVKIEMKSPGRETMIMTPSAHDLESESATGKRGNGSEDPSSDKTREGPQMTLE